MYVVGIEGGTSYKMSVKITLESGLARTTIKRFALSKIFANVAV